MNGTPRRSVISLSRPAVSKASSADSITHGPAIRNSGRSRPASKWQSFMSGLRTQRRRAVTSGGRGLGDRALRRLLRALDRGANVADEKGMPGARGRGDLRVELHPEEPGVGTRALARQLDDLGQAFGRRARDDAQAGRLQALDVVVVDLVAMPMPFVDRLAVDGRR